MRVLQCYWSCPFPIGLKMFDISPDSVMIIYGIIETLVQCIRFYIVLPLIKISFEEYFKKKL